VASSVGSYAGPNSKGEKPADLPVQQATKVATFINLKTATGITRCSPDEVIDSTNLLQCILVANGTSPTSNCARYPVAIG
jgi:hypothetical protein